MARESKVKSIDGVTVKIQQLPGFRAGKLWFRLMGVLGPSVARAGAGLKDVDLKKGGILGADLDLGRLLGSLGDSFEGLAEHFSEADYEKLLREVLEGATHIDGAKEMPLLMVFDDVTAGKPLLQLKILIFALEVNFSDFLPALVAKLVTAQQSARAESESKTSITSSGGGPVSVS